ncbi:MAG: hypothetical protein GEU98_19865 [Pseudonocardiaceae bacterium]|nr:hypothetical protein [Pseudonocardiaceae bacterium]
MSSTVVVTAVAAAAYFLIMLAIGRASSRGTSTSKESYFVANRELRGFPLFAAVFGTNMTAFVMLGLAGQTYRIGLGTWGMLIGASVLTLPVHFYFGYRCWLVARRKKITSPVEFYRLRYDSNALGILAFVFMVAWTLPVVLTGIIGGGRVFNAVTDGAIPFWLGGLILVAVVAYYTVAGGMRATAWTNTVQTVLFLGFLLIAVIWVPAASGGPVELFNQLNVEAPELISRNWDMAGFGPALSWFILFSSGNFATPYIWIRMVSAQSGRSLRRMGTVYPIAVLATWGSAILLGMWGAVLAPGLNEEESDSIVFILSSQLFPTGLVAVGLVGLLAIVMSSMDAQTLTISNLFTVDVVQRYRKHLDERSVVRYARVFVLAMLAILYVISLQPLPAVFDLATFAFTGFMTYFPMMVGGVLWRRATKAGAVSSLVIGQVVALAGYFELYGHPFGLETPFWVAIVSWGVFIVVSLFTAPPSDDVVETFHGEWDRVWAQHPPAGRPLAPGSEPAPAAEAP